MFTGEEKEMPAILESEYPKRLIVSEKGNYHNIAFAQYSKGLQQYNDLERIKFLY